MDNRIKALWIAALEGGEYKQREGGLVDTDENGNKSYCCLGVLCDLAAKVGVVTYLPDRYDENGKATSHEGFAVGEDLDTFNEFPNEAVRDWAGMAWTNPSVTVMETDEDDGQDYENSFELSELNDEKGWTFAQIAQIIREQL